MERMTLEPAKLFGETLTKRTLASLVGKAIFLMYLVLQQVKHALSLLALMHCFAVHSVV